MEGIHRAEMRFLDALKEYLRGVERGVTHAPVATVEIDPWVARRHLIEALERREQRDGSLTEETARRVHLTHGTVFVERLASMLSSGLCAGGSRDELQRHVHLAIDQLLDLPSEGLSRVRGRELLRAATLAEQLATDAAVSSDDVERYALEIRATRVDSGVTTVSPIGRVLLGLPEADAIAWLLSLEVQQSLGINDRWRMPIGSLDYLRRHPIFDPKTAELSEFGWAPLGFTIQRLVSLGVVGTWPDENGDLICDLSDAFKPIIDDLASRKRTPLYVLAETLIADERDALPSRALPSAQPHQSAAEIQARHARMVVHEIRNALVPVRLALSSLYEGIDASPPGDPMTRTRERIDRGVERVFRFIDEMGRVAQLGVTAPAPFDVAAAIRDAITGLNGGIQLDTRLAVDDALAPVLGYRDRFTLAVINLLRNAAQNSLKARATVHLAAVLGASRDRVIVTVDDDGPGVPEAAREDVFQQGFALRAGGSGQGLALVREVVEMEMKGQVHCESGALGGARFVLALPTAAKESP